MPAEVISMQDVARSTLPRSGDDQAYLGFCKALSLVKLMVPCSLEETKRSLESWLEAGSLTARELQALAEFYGWGATA